MKQLGYLLLAVCFFLSSPLIQAPSAVACVGKKIVIGTLVDPEQRILANMLALLIRERTGTTVEIQEFPEMESLASALKEDEIQIYSEYLQTGLKSLQLEATGQQNKVLLKKVKKEYNRRFNLVWLAPYGFVSSRISKASQLSAAPLIDKHTLKLFPALPRLLNKLGGIIDDSQLSKLIKSVEADNESAEEVARQFLKEQKLI